MTGRCFNLLRCSVIVSMLAGVALGSMPGTSWAGGSLDAEGAWIPLAPGGLKVHVAYMTIVNHVATDKHIIGADSPDYESVIPLIKDHPNLIVARTFSKIYGMAGLRCGYCVAQKETIARMRPRAMFDSVNCMALAAAIASLNDVDQVTNGKYLTSEAKIFTVTELDKLGYKTIPSQANFIMFDCKRPVVPLIAAMKQRNVQVGRLFPALPNHMRLTIGKKSEMEAFLSTLREVT